MICARYCEWRPGREAQPTAGILDSHTVQFTPSSGARASYDGAKRRKGSKVHAAVDTLGHLLALRVTLAAAAHQIELQVGKLPKAKLGFVLLPKRWVVECSFAWAARFRRLASDYERLPSSLAGYHWLAFVSLMLANLFPQGS